MYEQQKMARHLGYRAQFVLMQFVSVVMTLGHRELGYLSQNDPQQSHTHPCMVAALTKLFSKENKKKMNDLPVIGYPCLRKELWDRQGANRASR